MNTPPAPSAVGMPRRAFLVTSALASAGAVLQQATADPTNFNHTDLRRWPEPQLARLAPIQAATATASHAAPTARCARVAPAASIPLVTQPCRLRVTPLALPLHTIQAAADLELFYPGPALWTTLWTADFTDANTVQGHNHALAAPVESLAPAAFDHRVQLRITMRQRRDDSALNPADATRTIHHRFTLPAQAGAHLLAIPLTADAKPPAWRRCSTQATPQASAPTLTDPWRTQQPARGCAVVRLDLLPIIETIPTQPATPTHGGA